MMMMMMMIVVVVVVVVMVVVVVVVARLRRKSWPKFRTNQTKKLTATGENILSTFVRPEEICCLITYVITEGKPGGKVP